MELQGFVQRLALHLTSWQATTFLIGEYVEGELRDNPVFTVADGLFWLYQSVERNSIVRKMQVMKLRGQESVPGLHTFRITDAGLQTFPRTFGLTGRNQTTSRAGGVFPPASANSTRCMGGGIPEGDSLLVAGPSGAGKVDARHRNSSPRACAGRAGDRRHLRGAARRVHAAGRHRSASTSTRTSERRLAQDHLPPAAGPLGG